MANMSYCRHGNTSLDLMDVVEQWDDFNESEAPAYEIEARKIIIKLSRQIMEMEGQI